MAGTPMMMGNPFGGAGGLASIIAEKAKKKNSGGGVDEAGNLRGSGEKVPAASGPPVPSTTYTLEALKKCPPGVERARIEEWLKPEEFESAFGIGRAEYFKMAPWQRGRYKKKAGL